MYPEYALVCGETYKLNTDYTVAKSCFEIINDAGISDEERALAVIYKLFGFVPHENGQEFLDKAVLFLKCGREAEDNAENIQPDFDVNFDEGLIQASFQSCYGIDIDSEKMHWWKFMALFEGIDRSSELHRVMEIRQTDVGSIENPREKQRILRLQERYRIDAGLSAEDKVEIAGSVFSG